MRLSCLHNASLGGADPAEATVTGDQLAQAKSRKRATMPDGTVHG
ncbi:hypothetical protein ACFLWA_10150 [Chloroflexota bacterium]